MRYFEVLALTQNFQTTFTFLVERGLLLSERDCQCGTEMVWKEARNAVDGYIWECPASNCRKQCSIRTGSFFEDSEIPLGQWLHVIFLWSIDEANKQLSLLTRLSLNVVMEALQKLRDVCSLKILHGNVQLEGRGKTVEIDMFKYSHGRGGGACEPSCFVFEITEYPNWFVISLHPEQRSYQQTSFPHM